MLAKYRTREESKLAQVCLPSPLGRGPPTGAGRSQSGPGKVGRPAFPWGALTWEGCKPTGVAEGPGDLLGGRRRAGQQLLQPPSAPHSRRLGSCTWRPAGAGEGSPAAAAATPDSPGIARLPTCAQRHWEREYELPRPLASDSGRPGPPLRGGVCFGQRREG